MRKQFTVTLFGAGMNIPFDVKKAWGRARVPVTGTINGFKFRTTVCPMRGEYFVCVNRFMREGGKCGVGDTVKVVMEPDTAPRTITAPPDLKKGHEDQPGRVGLLGPLFLYLPQGIRAVDHGGEKAGDAHPPAGEIHRHAGCRPQPQPALAAPGPRRVQFRIRK